MSGTKFSKFLRFFSHLEFTHASLGLDPTLKVLYSFARQNLKMPWIAGFMEEHTDEGIFKLYNPMCEVLSLEVTEEQYEKLKEIISSFQYYTSQYHYNFLGVLLIYLNKPHKLTRYYTCTQFVAYILKYAGILQSNKDISLSIPTDFYDISGVKPIYKGRMSDYVSIGDCV